MLVGRRKVSNAAGGVSNAIGGKEDGAGIRDNKRAGGRQSRGATATKAAETSRKVEEGAGVGRKGGAGEFLEEFKGRGIDSVGEGGGPEAWIKVVNE